MRYKFITLSKHIRHYFLSVLFSCLLSCLFVLASLLLSLIFASFDSNIFQKYPALIFVIFLLIYGIGTYIYFNEGKKKHKYRLTSYFLILGWIVGLILSIIIGQSTTILVSHDGSRTGERVGYQSYCNPEQGIVIYENEKMPYTTEEGLNVLWTQGDIDCYKKHKENLIALPSASIIPAKKQNTSIKTVNASSPKNQDSKGKIVKYSEYCNKGKEISVYESELITKEGIDGESYSMTKDDWNCYEKNLSQSNVVNQRPTNPGTGLTFHCYDNTYKYWYYTSSGNECNLNNAKNGTYEICKQTAEFTVYDPCSKKCMQESSEGTEMCLWAYSGSNAAIENNSDLYSECSNEVTSKFTVCLDACSKEYSKEMDKCPR